MLVVNHFCGCCIDNSFMLGGGALGWRGKEKECLWLVCNPRLSSHNSIPPPSSLVPPFTPPLFFCLPLTLPLPTPVASLHTPSRPHASAIMSWGQPLKPTQLQLVVVADFNGVGLGCFSSLSHTLIPLCIIFPYLLTRAFVHTQKSWITEHISFFVGSQYWSLYTIA